MNEVRFRDADSFAGAKSRIEELTGTDLTAFLNAAFAHLPAPDLALANLERWLLSTTNPGLYFDQLSRLHPSAKLMIQLLGASQHIADALIQNPELGSLLLDPIEVQRPSTVAAIREEGAKLLTAATSHRHALDRLRFLKQRWNLPIVMNDLAGTWGQEIVWSALSALSEALIELAVDVAWNDIASTRPISVRPDLMVVAFGKLGGSELNYSSDIDLVYVSQDGLDAETERDCMRLCGELGRVLSDRMGRGSLYRVDLRLRPYGSSGPILQSMRAIEAYYKLYAEPWEIQALLRSRPVYGSAELRSRWDFVRSTHCFKQGVSEFALDQMLAMKARVEEGAQPGDLKRGEGGIRDVEFLVQIMQMLHGHERPEIQVRPTCDALRALWRAGFLEHSVADALIEGYTFLRRLEHRTQLVGDRQTHQIPSAGEARAVLASLMGYATWPEVQGILEGHRRTIQTLYRSTLHLEPPTSGSRSQVLLKLGPLGPAGLHWLESMPASEAFFDGLAENEESLDRLRTILRDAPRLVGAFKASLSLTELLLSGEILELDDVQDRILRLDRGAPLQQVAEVYAHCHTLLLAQWTLAPAFSIGRALSALQDALLCYCCTRFEICFDVVGLGSYGTQESCGGSDLDLLFLVMDPALQQSAERQAEQLLAFLTGIAVAGVRVGCDLRLRPEGGKGLLVRTFDGLKAYDFDGMQMWERFALGHGRRIFGSQEALHLVFHCAYGLPLTPERLTELVKMKRRIETERVNPQHVHRQIKLGSGGLNDIEWLVHLHEMRYPTASKAGESTDMDERIRRLATARLLNALEAEMLLDARRFLLDLRVRLYLNGMDDDLLPENPDKLDRLARGCGMPDGNSLLARHRSVVEPVRRLYMEALTRLKL